MQYKFTFSEEELNLILACIAKQPYEAVANVITKMQNQVIAQQNQVAQSVQKKPEEKK